MTIFEQWDNSTVGNARGAIFYKNGKNIEAIFVGKDEKGRWRNTTSDVFEASAGDYFETYAYQESDANLNMTSASMTVQKISD